MSLPLLLAIQALASVAAGAAPPAPLVQLWLLPHTHADVGWLELPEALARMNVSRILSGVVGNMVNDTTGARRFVWDEMYFLHWWWENTATAAERAGFARLVAERRIELVDNGWCQHDMGCTTVDSMLSNWQEGHSWLKEHFGEEARPRVGWSLDPFGLSASQATLQSLLGMEAWFFTRVPKTTLANMKADRTLEFVWRGSASLPANQTEIFCHVYESYYCMPVPSYAFEWGPARGAVIPDASNVVALSANLAEIARNSQGC